MSLRLFTDISFYLYCFSVGIESIDVLSSGGTFSISRLVGLIFVFICLINFLASNLIYFSKSTISATSIILIIFFIVILNTMINFGGFSKTFVDTTMILNIVFFLLLLNHSQQNEQTMLRGFKFFAFGALVTCSSMILGIGTSLSSDGRITMGTYNHNDLATIFVAGEAYFLSKIGDNFKVKTSLILIRYIIYILVFTYGIILTGSRGALVAIAMTFAIFTLGQNSKSYVGLFAKLAFTSIIVVLFINVIIANEAIMFRVQSIGDNNLADPDSLGGRVLIWTNAYEILKDNWFLGIGKSGYEAEQLLRLGNQIAYSPHNAYIEIFIYAGITGFVLFLAFCLKVLRASIKIKKIEGDILPVLLLPILFSVSFLGQIFSVKYFWLILAYILTRDIFLKRKLNKLFNGYPQS